VELLEEPEEFCACELLSSGRGRKSEFLTHSQMDTEQLSHRADILEAAQRRCAGETPAIGRLYAANEDTAIGGVLLAEVPKDRKDQDSSLFSLLSSLFFSSPSLLCSSLSPLCAPRT
jgi:hypothetical protein